MVQPIEGMPCNTACLFHESHNAIDEEQFAQRISYLRQKLIEELDGREEGYSDGTQLIVGRPPQTVLKNTPYAR